MKSPSTQEDRILRASEALFYRFGYNRVTTEQIATEAGVSKRTIYALFPTKMAIVIRSFVRAGREINATTANLNFEDRAHFEESLRQFFMTVANGSGRFSAPLVADLHQVDPKVGARIMRARRIFLTKHLHRILEKGQKQGAVRMGVNTDATIMVTLMALDCLLHPEARQALRLRAPEPETVVNVLLKGIRPR